MVAREAAAAAAAGVIVGARTPAERAAVRALHVEPQDHERAFRPSRAAGAEVHGTSLAGYEEQLADPEADAALLVAERAGRAGPEPPACTRRCRSPPLPTNVQPGSRPRKLPGTSLGKNAS
jgi:hypothetical protein